MNQTDEPVYTTLTTGELKKSIAILTGHAKQGCCKATIQPVLAELKKELESR